MTDAVDPRIVALERELRIVRRKLHRSEANRRILEAYKDRADTFHRRLMDEARHTQAKLKASEQAAQQASRAKSAFLATMSHELRTPLNSIIAYSELLQTEPELAESPLLLEDMGQIQQAGVHLLSLIDAILDLSQVESGQTSLVMEVVDIQGLVTELRGTVEPLAKKRGNRLQVQCSGVLDAITTDKTRLRQVLLNLLGNAAKFTENGQVLLRASPSHDAVLFEVIDTGPGISAHELPRVFDHFFKTESSRREHSGGVGLGLAVAAQLTQLMGGRISVDSKVGEGTCFSVVLPRNPAG